MQALVAKGEEAADRALQLQGVEGDAVTLRKALDDALAKRDANHKKQTQTARELGSKSVECENLLAELDALKKEIPKQKTAHAEVLAEAKAEVKQTATDLAESKNQNASLSSQLAKAQADASGEYLVDYALQKALCMPHSQRDTGRTSGMHVLYKTSYDECNAINHKTSCECHHAKW